MKKNIFYKKHTNWEPIFLSILIFVLLLFIYNWLSKKYIINITHSLPRGVYKLSTPVNINKGDVIVFSIPKKINPLIYKRGYAPSRVSSLLKLVGATTEDKIKIIQNTLFINEVSWGKIYKFDSLNRPLPILKENELQPKKNEILPLALTKNSFDGRYFGGISKDSIKYKAMLLIAF